MCKYCDESPIGIIALDIFRDKLKCSVLLSVCASVGALNPVVGVPMGVMGGLSVSSWINSYIDEMLHQSDHYADLHYPGCCQKYKEYVALETSEENFSEFWRVGKRMLKNNWVMKMFK